MDRKVQRPAQALEEVCLARKRLAELAETSHPLEHTDLSRMKYQSRYSGANKEWMVNFLAGGRPVSSPRLLAEWQVVEILQWILLSCSCFYGEIPWRVWLFIYCALFLNRIWRISLIEAGVVNIGTIIIWREHESFESTGGKGADGHCRPGWCGMDIWIKKGAEIGRQSLERQSNSYLQCCTVLCREKLFLVHYMKQKEFNIVTLIL